MAVISPQIKPSGITSPSQPMNAKAVEEKDPNPRACLGRFRISSMSLNYDFPSLQALMGEVVVIRAEHRIEDECIHYTGISPKHFAPIPQGSEIPEYVFEMSQVHKEVIRDINIECMRAEAYKAKRELSRKQKSGEASFEACESEA